MLAAFAQVLQMGLVEGTIIGNETRAKEKAQELGVSLDGVKFIDINEPDLAITAAGRMGALGETDLIIKGRVPTVAFLRLLLTKEVEFVPKGSLLSHISLIKPEAYGKLLFLTDAAVNAEPDLKIKLALIQNLARLAAKVGIEKPRIAVLAAVEVIYPQMQVTMDAAVIAKMADRGQIAGAFVDGPLSFDIAVDQVAAESKGIAESPVAGKADGLLAPNLETANGIYQAMALYGKAQLGGLLVGGKIPVAVTSRADSIETRINSILLSVLAARG